VSDTVLIGGIALLLVSVSGGISGGLEVLFKGSLESVREPWAGCVVSASEDVAREITVLFVLIILYSLYLEYDSSLIPSVILQWWGSICPVYRYRLEHPETTRLPIGSLDDLLKCACYRFLCPSVCRYEPD